MFTRGRIALSVLAVSALTLVGCTDNGDDATTTGTATATETTAAADATDATAEGENAEWVTFTEGFVKAKPAEKDMTGIFGIFTNNTDEDINITDFRIEGLAEDTVFEQHDTADGQMFEVPEGLTIPANGSLELAPGGKHLMIMNNMEDLAVGEEYTIVIELSDGSTITQDIDVRVQPAGEEDYAGDGSLSAPDEARPDASMHGDDEAGDADEHAGH